MTTLATLLCCLVCTVLAHSGKNFTASDFFKTMEKGDKAAILMVHFGTTHDETRKQTIDALNEQVQQQYPDIEVRESYTSRIIIGRLNEKGIPKLNPVDALKRLYAEGYTHILIQSSAVIDGAEQEALYRNAENISFLFKEIRIGDPLLYTPHDYNSVIDVLTRNTDKRTAYVLVGHGTFDAATAQYAMLDYMLKDKGHTNFFVGTIEGYPESDHVLSQLKTTKLKNVVLVPFMFVAGEHAKNDIAGEWKETFEKAGYNVNVRMEGLGENPDIRDIYLSHLTFIMHHKKTDILDKKTAYTKSMK